ncbi:MAG: sulfatase [Undibacterium sp.]|nr:sulfatase [Opitutaceae bacterium]
MKRIFFAVFFPLLTASHGEAAIAARPNILFCVSDDQSFPHAGAYGCTWVRTPAFDRVAREGLLFARAYTPNAKCAPSRACILTGRNSWQLEDAANHGGYFPAKFKTFVEALGAHGYHTGFTGKGWGPGEPGKVDGAPRLLTGRAYSSLRAAPPTAEISPLDYAANFEQFLRERPAGQPFFFWYGGNEPHRRYAAGSGARLGGKSPEQIERVPSVWPDTAAVRNDLLDYAFEIEHFDRHLGRMLAALAAAGELEHTLVVVTSDNGMPFPRAKGTAYELSNHLPLAIRWSGGIARPGRIVGDYVSFVDFAPTFLEAAGVPTDTAGMAPIAGRTLGPLFRDAEAPAAVARAGRDHVLVGQERHDVGRPRDEGYPVRGIFRDDFLYLHNFEPTRWPMCDPITGYLNTDGSPTKSLILAQNRLGVNRALWALNFGRRPAEELYDLRADRDCVVNLAADAANAGRRAAMRRQLFEELAAQKDPRMAGQGAVFDHYPHASYAGFYERFMRGEKKPTPWVEATDYEKPGFDPELPPGEKPLR